VAVFLFAGAFFREAVLRLAFFVVLFLTIF